MSKKSKTSKKAIREAVRVVGYLLETNGATGGAAFDSRGNLVSAFDPKACYWCAIGAMNVVSQRMNVQKKLIADSVATLTKSPQFVDYVDFIGAWDDAGMLGRQAFVEACKNA